MYPCPIFQGYSSAAASMLDLVGILFRITLTNQAWIQQRKNNPHKSGMDTAAEE
jgi:hypothetical protein